MCLVSPVFLDVAFHHGMLNYVCKGIKMIDDVVVPLN